MSQVPHKGGEECGVQSCKLQVAYVAPRLYVFSPLDDMHTMHDALLLSLRVEDISNEPVHPFFYTQFQVLYEAVRQRAGRDHLRGASCNHMSNCKVFHLDFVMNFKSQKKIHGET